MLGNYPPGTHVTFIGKKGRTVSYIGEEREGATQALMASNAANESAHDTASKCSACAAKAEAAQRSDQS